MYETDEGLEVRRFLGILWRYRLLIVLAAVVSVALAASWTASQEPAPYQRDVLVRMEGGFVSPLNVVAIINGLEPHSPRVRASELAYNGLRLSMESMVRSEVELHERQIPHLERRVRAFLPDYASEFAIIPVEASAVSQPVKRWYRNLFLAGMLGMMVGFLGVLAIEYLRKPEEER